MKSSSSPVKFKTRTRSGCISHRLVRLGINMKWTEIAITSYNMEENKTNTQEHHELKIS